jgi:hypothetical protein
MSSTVDFGKPLFTDGVFGAARAQDDLGVEEVGAGLLRRLIPGVIQNTPNSAYYSLYPYLLWKWEQLGGEVERGAFIPFFRRHESAFAVACVMHSHRDDVSLSGINGAIAARQRAHEIDAGATELDLDAHARDYMDTPLGGYGLFYAVALQDARLVIAGAQGLVDRVSEHGAAVAAAFAETFEQTTYAQKHLTSTGSIPAEVLRELGDATCLCTVPGRSDHELLLETFFGSPLSSPTWEERRRNRVESLSLLLEFHAQRPSADEDDLAAWRRALVGHQFSTGKAWTTTHSERRESWRAYQLRELSVLALTTIWSIYLGELIRRGRATHEELTEEMISWLTDSRLGFDPSSPLEDATVAVDDLLPHANRLALEAEPLESEWRDERERGFCRAVRVLMTLPREISRAATGFSELLEEGGSHRWSLQHLDAWLGARAEQPVAETMADLLDALQHQHVRVALSKVRVPSAENLRREKGSWRDPFNFADDDGMLRPLRPDEPFWTGARYGVGNHLLWSLGLLTSPVPPIALTQLGEETLIRNAGNA